MRHQQMHPGDAGFNCCAVCLTPLYPFSSSISSKVATPQFTIKTSSALVQTCIAPPQKTTHLTTTSIASRQPKRCLPAHPRCPLAPSLATHSPPRPARRSASSAASDCESSMTARPAARCWRSLGRNPCVEGGREGGRKGATSPYLP